MRSEPSARALQLFAAVRSDIAPARAATIPAPSLHERAAPCAAPRAATISDSTCSQRSPAATPTRGRGGRAGGDPHALAATAAARIGGLRACKLPDRLGGARHCTYVGPLACGARLAAVVFARSVQAHSGVSCRRRQGAAAAACCRRPVGPTEMAFSPPAPRAGGASASPYGPRHACCFNAGPHMRLHGSTGACRSSGKAGGQRRAPCNRCEPTAGSGTPAAAATDLGVHISSRI